MPTQGATIIDIVRALEEANKVTNPAIVQLEEPAVAKLDPELAQNLEAFKAAKKLMKLAQDEKDAQEAIIREALGECEVGQINGRTVVTVSHGKNTGVRAAIVRDGWPEAYEAAYRETPYTVLHAK